MANRQRQYETGYQALTSYYDDEHEDAPPCENIQVVPDRNKSRWNHIENLDEFFSRVYQYHQRNGFLCMVFQDAMQLVQFAFVVMFATFLWQCVDYDTLFYENQLRNETHKVSISDAVYPLGQCVDRFTWLNKLCLVVAAIFWLFRLFKMLYNANQYMEIREFYLHALKISQEDMCNLTWHEVQRCLLEVQKEEQMCIHKQDLTELDIYHRILRYKNYLIAMVNKNLLPLKFPVPLLKEYTFMTTGLKYNLEIILFWGPGGPFANNWHLKPDYKNYHCRKELAEQLARRILWVGIANLVLSPLIFLWQILYSFFRYAEALKRSPGTFGARCWSIFGRLYLRHFNELDHEFDTRLNRGYKPAERYMNSFTSPFLTILAKFGAFFSGAILSVFVILTLVDEDFLQVQHVVLMMAVFGGIAHVCHTLIPDEHMVWCPEQLMAVVLANIHYMPTDWKGNAHTYTVRDAFSQLFQYKAVALLEELLSPLLTPFILIFPLRHKALDIVDFYRNFTVEVTGVGDVCSFAQMDVRKHGNPQWSESKTEANQYQQTADGKTELSLMHFTYTNPEWKPPQPSTAFLTTLREQVQQDVTSMSTAFSPFDNPLATSLHSLTSVGFGQYNSMLGSVIAASAVPTPTAQPPTAQAPGETTTLSSAPASFSNPTYASSASSTAPCMPPAPPRLGVVVRGLGVRHAEGPLGGSSTGILSPFTQQMSASMAASHSTVGEGGGNPVFPSLGPGRVDEHTLELLSNEMGLGALYMHERHRQRLGGNASVGMASLGARGQYHDISSSSTRFTPAGGVMSGLASSLSRPPQPPPQPQPQRMGFLAAKHDMAFTQHDEEEEEDEDCSPPHEFTLPGMHATAGGMLHESPRSPPRIPDPPHSSHSSSHSSPRPPPTDGAQHSVEFMPPPPPPSDAPRPPPFS